MLVFGRLPGLLRIFFISLPLAVILSMGCGATTPTSAPANSPAPSFGDSMVITLGDIDSTDPVKKINRFQPLADYMADGLADAGIIKGEVIIARDTEEMSRLLQSGRVDLYFDSPFPALRVQQLSGSRIVLRRWKEGNASYWSTYIALKDSEINSVQDFLGKVIVFEEPLSTSGFLLPAGTLIQRGFQLKKVTGPDSPVASGEIGYFFAGDEENTVALVTSGRAAGGAISNEDYDELPIEIMERLTFFGKTIVVPRQVVSVAPNTDSSLEQKMLQLLINLDDTEEGRRLLEGLQETRKFDLLPPESEASLDSLKSLIQLIAEE